MHVGVKADVVVPTPLEGGGTIYSTGFFLFRQFWPIDIFIVELRLVSLESLSSLEKGIKFFFLNFRFLQGVIEVYTFEKIE